MSQQRGQLVEGEHYFCGLCVGRASVPCDFCVEGTTRDGRCDECKGVGQVRCPTCKGGAKPSVPPDYL